MIITFFGHSSYLGCLEDEERLLAHLERIANKEQVDFYLGGYGKFDCFAYKCAKKYKQKHFNARLVFITPYLDNWLNKRKEELEEAYDFIVYPEIENVPKKFAILKRNEWMVNKSDFIFAYVRTHYGGAYKILLYAKKRKKAFINLYSGTYELY